MAIDTTLLIVFIVIILSWYFVYNVSKKKNLSLVWNLFWAGIFGPLWWVVIILQKKRKELPNEIEAFKKVSIFLLFIILFSYMYFLTTPSTSPTDKISDNNLLWLTMFITALVITIPTFAFVSFDKQD
jgi:hypothetical protein